MDYQTMTRDQQNQILRQNGYRWVKIDQDWLDANDDFNTVPGWYLYAAGGREVSVPRAFAEIERGVETVAEEYRQAAEKERREAQKRQDSTTWKNHLADKIRDGGVRPDGEPASGAGSPTGAPAPSPRLPGIALTLSETRS